MWSIGIYQCFAKNKHSEVNITNYLSIRNLSLTGALPKSPHNMKCYPTDFNGFLVTFETHNNQQIDMISYYLATQNPYQWISPSPVPNFKIEGIQNSVNITIDRFSNIVPFKPYMLFLRGMKMTTTSSNSVMITRMTKGIQCATQGRKL